MARPVVQKYSDWYTRGKLDYKQFAKRLWGDFYFDESTRKFVRTAVRVHRHVHT